MFIWPYPNLVTEAVHIQQSPEASTFSQKRSLNAVVIASRRFSIWSGVCLYPVIRPRTLLCSLGEDLPTTRTLALPQPRYMPTGAVNAFSSERRCFGVII